MPAQTDRHKSNAPASQTIQSTESFFTEVKETFVQLSRDLFETNWSLDGGFLPIH